VLLMTANRGLCRWLQRQPDQGGAGRSRQLPREGDRQPSSCTSRARRASATSGSAGSDVETAATPTWVTCRRSRMRSRLVAPLRDRFVAGELDAVLPRRVAVSVGAHDAAGHDEASADRGGRGGGRPRGRHLPSLALGGDHPRPGCCRRTYATPSSRRSIENAAAEQGAAAHRDEECNRQCGRHAQHAHPHVQPGASGADHAGNRRDRRRRRRAAGLSPPRPLASFTSFPRTPRPPWPPPPPRRRPSARSSRSSDPSSTWPSTATCPRSTTRSARATAPDGRTIA
jgi:hypothetical protein